MLRLLFLIFTFLITLGVNATELSTNECTKYSVIKTIPQSQDNFYITPDKFEKSIVTKNNNQHEITSTKENHKFNTTGNTKVSIHNKYLNYLLCSNKQKNIHNKKAFILSCLKNEIHTRAP